MTERERLAQDADRIAEHLRAEYDRRGTKAFLYIGQELLTLLDAYGLLRERQEPVAWMHEIETRDRGWVCVGFYREGYNGGEREARHRHEGFDYGVPSRLTKLYADTAAGREPQESNSMKPASSGPENEAPVVSEPPPPEPTDD